LVKAAMVHLSGLFPFSAPFVQVLDVARGMVANNGQPASDGLERDTQALGQAFLTFYASASTSLVELSLHGPRFTTTASAKPVASRLARQQAATRSRVTNLRHETVVLGEFERQVLRLLDGTRDTAALQASLADLVARGDLAVEQDGQPIHDNGKLGAALATALGEQLPRLARQALLVS
jgi:hypothetical protein